MSQDDDIPEKPSKTQLKKEMITLQKLGDELVALSTNQLSKLELPEELLDAIVFAKSLSSHGAMRRQSQQIGKVMRHIDAQPIREALARLNAPRVQEVKQFHEVEKWRDELIEQGDVSLNAFLALYPDVDRQQLRQLIRNAKKDRQAEKKTGGELALFRYLKDIV